MTDVIHRCGICGGPDQRHQRVETQMGQVIGGDDIETVAGDHGLTVPEMVQQWADAYDTALTAWEEADG